MTRYYFLVIDSSIKISQNQKLSVVQQSPKSMVLETRPMPQLGKQQKAANRAGLNSSQQNYQHPRSRGQGGAVNDNDHLYESEARISNPGDLKKEEGRRRHAL